MDEHKETDKPKIDKKKLSMLSMRKWICNCAIRLEHSNRDILMQFLVSHLRETDYIKEGSDGSRVNLDILSDDMIRIIYNFINDTLIKEN